MFHFRHEFEVSYQLDIPNICSDFQEDLEFHFSLGWRTMLRKLVAPYNRRLAIVLGADVGLLCLLSVKIIACSETTIVYSLHKVKLMFKTGFMQ